MILKLAQSNALGTELGLRGPQKSGAFTASGPRYLQPSNKNHSPGVPLALNVPARLLVSGLMASKRYPQVYPDHL